MDVVGVVLGGGEGRRFGGDKLLAMVDGVISLHRVASVLREAGARLVYVLTRGSERCRLYKGVTGIDGCLYDVITGCRGPGAALAALHEIDAEIVLIAPGDAPWLEPRVFQWLAAFLGECNVAAPLHGNGFVETLVLAARGEYASSWRRLAERLCMLRGDVRPSDYLRFAPCSILVGSSLLASSPTIFAHINTMEALRTRAARNPLGDGLVVNHGGALLSAMLDGSLDALCRLFSEEMSRYRGLGLAHLERHARRDYEHLCRAERGGRG